MRDKTLATADNLIYELESEYFHDRSTVLAECIAMARRTKSHVELARLTVKAKHGKAS